ncbi:putative tetratricopeptide-like helical domain superfamily [Helianthus annuus]|nr:putative tetratricopeptide-like helical domain superfamily [Helianthus annuus]
MFFSPKIQSRTKPLTSHLFNHSKPLFSTHTTPYINPNQQQQPPETHITHTNISHLTKKIHNLCTIDHNVDEAIRLTTHLHTQNYPISPLNISSIVHALCDSYRFADAHSFLTCFLSFRNVPDERTCNVIIARLLHWKTPDVTLRVVNQIIMLKPCFVPSLVNFNRLIHQFCTGLRVRVGHMLLLKMKGMGQWPNVVTYTSLIDGYCGIGEVGVARKVFDEMSEWGVKANSLTFSVLIGGVVRNKGSEFESSLLVGKMWKSMDEEDDVLVNHAAFTNLINSFCQAGLFKSVFDIAEKMPECKNINDGFAYAQMIDSLCRYGRHHGASRIVYMMAKRGCVPSSVSYNSIIHGLTKNGGYLRAYQLLEQAVETGYTPSETTYKILIERLCLEEYDLVKAKKLLDIMLNKEGVDKARVYNIYLRALCQIKTDVSTELLNTLVTMLETRCHPDVVTLNTVINGFCKMGKVDDGIKVLNDMVMKKFNFCTPDSVTFTTIISGLLSIGRTKEALDILFKLMPEKGFHPNVITYNVVLRGLFKLNLANEAMNVFKRMVDGGVDADCTTHAIMIGGLCECDRVDEAKVFWDDIVWPSKVHDSFVYSAMVKGLCSVGKFNEACDFAYELVDCGVRLNVVNYNILIEGACKLGLKKDAYQIVGEMRKNGLVPDAVTWRIIDKLHKKKVIQTVKSDYSDNHFQNAHPNAPLIVL